MFSGFCKYGCFLSVKYIALNFYTLLSGSLIFLNLGLVPLTGAKEELSTVHNLTIPRFNDDGHLSWELHASEVKSKDKETFLTKNPLLYLFNKQILDLTAKSESGEFSLQSERANGPGLFEVVGDGFSARGINWQWNNSVPRGHNQMIFSRDGKVIFDQGLGGFFVVSSDKDDPICNLTEEERNQTTGEIVTMPTIAQANYLEFLSIINDSHLFLLDGNVSIEGSNLLLTCDQIEVLFVKDANVTSSEIGKISRMDAKGKVVLRQGGRTSYGNHMTLDVTLGTVLLNGEARVVDDEWGEASGERIVLEKGKRKARVLGGANSRPKLELPPLPDFGFNKKSKKSINQ